MIVNLLNHLILHINRQRIGRYPVRSQRDVIFELSLISFSVEPQLICYAGLNAVSDHDHTRSERISVNLISVGSVRDPGAMVL